MASENSCTKRPSVQLNQLSGIPLDLILKHLDLASFTNLRLTSRQLSTSAICSHFFRSSKIELSLDSLRSLQGRISHPQLGPQLRELTFVATLFDTQIAEATVQTKKKWSGFDRDALWRDTENYRQRVEYLRERNVPCTDEEVEEAQRDLDWIQMRIQQDTNTEIATVVDLLSGILVNATNLRSIDLDACIIAGRTKTCLPAEHHKWYRSTHQDSSWPSVWTAASQTFRIVTSAISRSRIELERFHIFPDTPLCSVRLREVEDHLRTLDSSGFSTACKTIKSFGLSISTCEHIEAPPPNEDKGRKQGECLSLHAFAARRNYRHDIETTAEDFTGAASILKFMPNLASLDIHLHCLKNLFFHRYSKVFAHIARDIRLGRLREISIRGLPLHPDDLVLFLRNHSTIIKLSLDGIRLVGKSWSTVFACIESMPALENLYLCSLRTDCHHITNLDPVERSFEVDLEDREKWVACGNGHILYKREMCKEEIRQGLCFRPQPGPRDVWKDNTLAYYDRIQYEFGPPSSVWAWDPLHEDV
ncbi:f-box domain protein [Fusarium beomiforme]|uniref:F-box domain protein n=1 Tax=Fusarium beomiforme TaxID=44412 RepID=A0A9P5ARH3_9HYPO|nr:f-box domain protein [Fusarium beomiforme]